MAFIRQVKDTWYAIFPKPGSHNLIVFLNTGPEDRSICFNALQPLVGILTDEWGEFVNKRASRIAEKVILPLLEKSPEVLQDNLLKVLDVGSGVGMVLSNIVRCLAASSPNMPNIQARLLDRIAMDPKVQFTSDQVMKHISSIEYIKTDYKTWFDQFTVPYKESYNITFIYRLLHTMSEFRILPEPPQMEKPELPKDYSDYFRAAHLFCGGHRPEKAKGEIIYHPRRIFNQTSLETASGKSILEKCVGMSTWTIVEDLDLDPMSLINHLIRHSLYSNMLVYDLSQALHLRTNYIYCLCSAKEHAPEIGRQIWPN